jgi:hypothetical protein
MTQVALVRDGDLFRLVLKPPQRDLLDAVLLFIAARGESEAVVTLCTGTSSRCLADLRGRAADAHGCLVSLQELHVLHAALLATKSFFASEEDFFLRIGFFRENADELARNLVVALDRAGAPPSLTGEDLDM